MRALDTNVLVRYLAQDEPRQSLAVTSLMEKCRATGEPLFVPVLVLCETVWVLRTVHRQTKQRIVDVMEHVLQIDVLCFEDKRLIERSLEKFRNGRADFADYVIGEVAQDAGCRDTVTFDKALKNASGFSLL